MLSRVKTDFKTQNFSSTAGVRRPNPTKPGTLIHMVRSILSTT